MEQEIREDDIDRHGEGKTDGVHDSDVRRVGHLDAICRSWERFDEASLVEADENSLVLRLRPLLQHEDSHAKNIARHGNIRLVGIYGRARTRERLLGYVLEYVGRPIIHEYTWYVGLSYTAPDDVRRKPMKVLHSDDHVRLLRAGIGVERDGIQAFDYLFCYRKRTPQHDEDGFSDGSVAIQTARTWQDGL